MVKRKRTHNNK